MFVCEKESPVMHKSKLTLKLLYCKSQIPVSGLAFVCHFSKSRIFVKVLCSIYYAIVLKTCNYELLNVLLDNILLN